MTRAPVPILGGRSSKLSFFPRLKKPFDGCGDPPAGPIAAKTRVFGDRRPTAHVAEIKFGTIRGKREFSGPLQARNEAR